MDTPPADAPPTLLPLALGQVRTLLDALPCAAILLSEDGRIVHANPPAAGIIDIEPARLAGLDLRTLCTDPADRQRVERWLAGTDARGEIESHVVRHDGTRIPVIASFNRIDLLPALPPAPGTGYRVVTLVDVHRLKDSESSLKFQQEFLVQMSDTVLQQALGLKELNDKLEDRVARRTAELHDANMDAIFMLAVAAEAKDHDTGAHVLRMQRYCHALAVAAGLAERDAAEVGYSSILHDVGKLHVPDRILNKPGPLTEAERRAMEQHTVVGERILSTRPFFRRARLIARGHHENFDGSGYPDGLRGPAIPLEARITHVADVYDALTSARAYKEAWSVRDAMRMIRESAGTLFDPDIAAALARLHDSGELDTLTIGFCEFTPTIPPPGEPTQFDPD